MNSTAVTPDWSSIDTVLLDMDGTLLDLGFDIHFWQEWVPRHFAASRRLPVDEARRLMKPIFEPTHGTLDWYCIDYWSRALVARHRRAQARGASPDRLAAEGRANSWPGCGPRGGESCW